MTFKPMNTSPASFAGNRSAKSKRAPKNEIIPILPKKAKLYRSEPTQGTIDYKNILLLRKFITAEGKILPRRISGLTSKQQRHMTKAIKNARVMSLLPFISQSRAFV